MHRTFRFVLEVVLAILIVVLVPTFSLQSIRSNRISHFLPGRIVLKSKWPSLQGGQQTRIQVSSGFIFEDGEQVLASLQKPLGLILEEDTTSEDGMISVFVAEVLPGSSGAVAGLLLGDVVIAVQNVDMQGQSLEYVMATIQQAPKVLNMRVQRRRV